MSVQATKTGSECQSNVLKQDTNVSPVNQNRL